MVFFHLLYCFKHYAIQRLAAILSGMNRKLMPVVPDKNSAVE